MDDVRSPLAWDRLEAAEPVVRAEEEAERAHQERQRAREAAEDDWVDRVVAEQEALADARTLREADAEELAASAASRDGVALEDATAAEEAATAALDWARWELALAPFGLKLVASGAPGGGGRGLAAGRSFARGEVILRTSPAVSVLNGESLATCCHHCHVRGRRLLACTRCGCARYCSAAHQRAAWKEHKDECDLLARTRPRVPGQTVRLLARLLSLLRRSADAAANTADTTTADTTAVDTPIATNSAAVDADVAADAAANAAEGAATSSPLRYSICRPTWLPTASPEAFSGLTRYRVNPG